MKRFVAAAVLLVFALPALAQDKDGKWRGSLETNFTIVNSNKNSENFLFVGKAKSERPLDRFSLDGYYNFARQTNAQNVFETSTDQWSFGGRYERDFGFKSFYYGNARFERDGVNLLDLRTILGVGLGYTLREDESTAWRVSGGGSWVNEKYRTDTNAFFGFQFESNFSTALSERLDLVHDFRIIPDFSNLDDYYFSSNLGLSYELNASLSAGVRYIVNFDNTPAPGAQKQNTTYAFVLGYKF